MTMDTATAFEPVLSPKHRQQLISAYAYLFLCSQKSGRDEDRENAGFAIRQLRALGRQKPPAGISQTDWDNFPELDATTNVHQVTISLATLPTGARVWLDYREIGGFSGEITVSEGPHLVAVAAGNTVDAMLVDAHWKMKPPEFRPVEHGQKFADVAQQVASWQSGDDIMTPDVLAGLLRKSGVRFAFVITGDGHVELWGLPPGANLANQIAVESADFVAKSIHIDKTETNELLLYADVIAEHAARWDGRELSSVTLTHTDEKPGLTRREWYIYGGLAGVVVFGAAVLLAYELGDDRQQIELHWP